MAVRGPEPFRVGEEIAGRYRVESLLGRGGAGAVYRVYDQLRGCERALKVHAPTDGSDDASNWRLRREFYLMAQLGHPNIVRVHEWGEDREHLYFTMDLIRGRDTADLVPMAPADVLEVMVALTAALGFVHSRGYVHQDVKPRNIRIPDAPSGGVLGARGGPMLGALLMDFGLLTPIAADTPQAIGGTPGYLAPEVLLGEAPDARSDLYAVGATAHVLLTGLLPTRQLSGYGCTVSLPSSVPAPLVTLLRDLLTSDPRRRLGDASELCERLAQMTPAARSVELAAPAYLAAPPLVGRKRELQRVRQLFHRASEGEGGGLYVVASPGLGKSRLLRSAALELRISGALVVETAGNQHLRTPLRTLLPLLEAAGIEPDVRLDPAQATRILETLSSWARREAAERPVVLVVDDLQWCDETSTAILEKLTRALRGGRFLLLAAVRVDEGSPPGPLTERLGRGGLEVLYLDPLDGAGVVELLRGLFGKAVIAPKILERIVSACGGNPYLAIEIARALVDDGYATFEQGRWRLARSIDALRLPTTVEEALAERVERLGPDAQTLANALAIAGGAQEGRLLAAVTGLPEGRMLVALDELAARQVAVTSAGRTRLLHARLQELLRDRLPPKEREALHLSLAHQLQARLAASRREAPADANHEVARVELGRLVGHHLARAGRSVELEAIPWLTQAAEAAHRAQQLGDAVEPLRVAAEILDRRGGPDAHPELVDIWERLGMILLPYDLEGAIEIYTRLLEHLDRDHVWEQLRDRAELVGPRLAVLAGLVETGWRNVLRRGSLAQRVSAARGTVSDVARYVMARTYLSSMKIPTGSLAFARRSADLLLDFARARGDATALVYGLSSLAAWSYAVGRFEESIVLLEKAHRLLTAPGEPVPRRDRQRIEGNLAMLRLWIQALRGESTDSELASDLAILEQSPDEGLQNSRLIILGAYRGKRGEVTRLLAQRQQFLERCHTLRGTWTEAMVYPATTPLLAEAGYIATVRDDVRAFEALAPRGLYREIWSRILRGLLLNATGQPDEAVPLFEVAARIADCDDVGAESWSMLAAMYRCEALLDLGRLAETNVDAKAIIARSRAPHMRYRLVELRCHSILSRAALLVGDTEIGGREAARVTELASSLRNPGERAAALFLKGLVARAEGDLDLARTLGRESELRFSELGHRAGSQRAAELARGGSPTRVLAVLASEVLGDAPTQDSGLPTEISAPFDEVTRLDVDGESPSAQ